MYIYYKCFSVKPEYSFPLDNAITELMHYFRVTWPEQSITTKLHLLEDHALPFIQKWGAGFGLYGEQKV